MLFTVFVLYQIKYYFMTYDAAKLDVNNDVHVIEYQQILLENKL